MSQLLISRNPDLKRLRDDGYDVEIRSLHLLVKNVPYVNARREVKRGILVSTLTTAGDLTTTPDNHVVYFIGEHPCLANGTEIEKIKNPGGGKELAKDVVVNHTFSARPSEPHPDYYAKMATYVAILEGQAQVLEHGISARGEWVVEPDAGDDTVFNYMDTASSRAGIGAVTDKLAIPAVAIVGLGGTGAYVLDLVAKTPVKEIHLFDGDEFLTHNAFRAPGAPAVEELRTKRRKVDYLCGVYSKMRRGIIAHPEYLGAGNIELLKGMLFVFLTLDRGTAKKLIVEKLEQWGIPFVDAGMGVYSVENMLAGVLRVTTSTPEKREHFRQWAPFSDGEEHNEYALNIQIADLNALNATLAVIKWKKLSGFYVDLDREHHSTYTIDGNALANEEHRR